MTLALLLLWMTLGTPDCVQGWQVRNDPIYWKTTRAVCARNDGKWKHGICVIGKPDPRPNCSDIKGKLSAQPGVSQIPASQAQRSGWSEWRCAGCEMVDAHDYAGKKPHRWFAETRHGQPLTSYQHTHPGATRATPCDGTKELCWSGWMIVDETVELDICLEHGETRVREWK